jgi:hypothetical protein
MRDSYFTVAGTYSLRTGDHIFELSVDELRYFHDDPEPRIAVFAKPIGLVQSDAPEPQ